MGSLYWCEVQLLNDEMEKIQWEAPYGRMGAGWALRYQGLFVRSGQGRWEGVIGDRMFGGQADSLEGKKEWGETYAV